MSWGRVENPTKTLNVGDTIKVFVKEIKDGKIALSCKFDNENPWNGAAEKYAVGTVVKGKVVRMKDFGAFVNILPGIDGMLHISQISDKRLAKVTDALQVGDEINVRLDAIDEKGRLSLSMKGVDQKA